MSAAPATASPAWAALASAGCTRADAFADRAAELAAVRSVARRDLGLARILDGHRNGLERVLLHRPQDVPADLRAAVRSGAVALGVWGADPRPGEGDPARLVTRPDGGLAVDGVKTFCSGAGVVQLALVLVRPAPGAAPDVLALVDVAAPGAAEIDRAWFASPALRTSESHRVVLRSAPVVAVLGGPGALVVEPWLAGDALRTAATWAGALDTVVAATVDAFADRVPTDAEALLAGRMTAAHAAVDVWLARATAAVEAAHAPQAPLVDPDRAARTPAGPVAPPAAGALGPPAAGPVERSGASPGTRPPGRSGASSAAADPGRAEQPSGGRGAAMVAGVAEGLDDPARAVLLARLQIADRSREVLRIARELTGSWPVATDDPGARAARDLDLLLVQHRLTPAATRLGRTTLGAA